MNRFYRDSCKQIFEEVEPGLLRGVTAWDGSRYIQEQTISKKYLETLRGPLVEVPDPWMASSTKILRVQDVIERWEDEPQGTGGVSALLSELHIALGHEPEREET